MENFEAYPILNSFDGLKEYQALPTEQLPALAAELREYLSFRVRENGGHLASNLGAVELTMALHRVFDCPRDHIIFDVGHQSYVHKILTDRKSRFDTLRQAGGISGFTKREESVYDAFGTGHSSTAISAAIGFSEADALSGSDAYTVAVVGDGALTGGLAYEGLNNCRRSLRLIIIINDNEMSISPNTGRLAAHLSKIRASKNYLKTKEFTARTLRRIPLIGRPTYKLLRRAKRRIKHMLYRENLFEHMGIRYLGPVDGNDVAGMIACLEHAKKLECSVILHVKTKKGKGDFEAEAEPKLYHGVSPHCKTPPVPTFSEQFGNTLCRLAAEDERICAITAAMSCGTGLDPFKEKYPRRFFDVGIAEGHAVTFASGLAANGKKPVVALYSTFLQRAYDNVIHDAALQGLPVVLAIDRAGFNAADGPTHHGVFDVSFLSAIDGVSIYTPVTDVGVEASLRAALGENRVAALRYISGTQKEEIVNAFYPSGVTPTDTPRVRMWQTGDAPVLTVVTHGRIAAEALAAARELAEAGTHVRILLCEYIAPYERLAAEVAPLLSGKVIFFEEEIRRGGFGMTLADTLSRKGALTGVAYDILAAEHAFVTVGLGETIFGAAGVDKTVLLASAKRLLDVKE